MLKITVDWKVYLSLGLLLALCLPIVHQWFNRDIWYFCVLAYGLLGIIWGIKLNKSEVLSPWIYFLLSIISQCMGALIQSNTDASGSFGSGLSPADLFLLAGHLLLASSLWQFSSKLHQEFPKHGLYQGWILATSLILVAWQFLFLPTIVKNGFSIYKPQIFRMLYPTLSYIEVGMLLWMWESTESRRSPAFILLVMATVLFAVGESVFHGTSYSLGVPYDFNLVLWLAAYVTFGAVALHPGMRLLGIPRLSRESSHFNNVLTLLLPMVLLLPVTLLIIYFKELQVATIGILIGFFLVIVIGWYQLIASMRRITQFSQLLETQNRTDYLTGVPNRNHIEHVVGALIDNVSSLYGRGYNGLLLIDIDGFKAINNTFGFSVGDAILQSIAVTLHKESLKKDHHFARVDGDEFVLLIILKTGKILKSRRG